MEVFLVCTSSEGENILVVHVRVVVLGYVVGLFVFAIHVSVVIVIVCNVVGGDIPFYNMDI